MKTSWRSSSFWRDSLLHNFRRTVTFYFEFILYNLFGSHYYLQLVDFAFDRNFLVKLVLQIVVFYAEIRSF
jgi:hypothetical protein